jgi:hypothetical protein
VLPDGAPPLGRDKETNRIDVGERYFVRVCHGRDEAQREMAVQGTDRLPSIGANDLPGGEVLNLQNLLIRRHDDGRVLVDAQRRDLRIERK